LREHLKNRVSVSELCEKYGIHPNVLYKWEKQQLEGALESFSHEEKINERYRNIHVVLSSFYLDPTLMVRGYHVGHHTLRCDREREEMSGEKSEFYLTILGE